MTFSTLKQPSAFIPIAMSFAAIGVVVFHIMTVGIAREPDEGTAAHLWQILMVGQIPVIALFAVTSLPRAPRHAVSVLALQGLAVLAAVIPVFLLNW